jgi:hypothetical protein
MCEKFNIRYIFLPQNSTHLMQPLDVAVFAPMKRRWREILSEWKDACVREGKNFATIPKQEFPRLLKELLAKDYSSSIRSGFSTTGLFPLSLEKALSKLPAEDREVENNITQKFIDKLSAMRYDPPSTTHANRPKKNEKLPAGASYTCLPGKPGEVGLAVDIDEGIEEESREEVEETGFMGMFSDSSSDEEMTQRTNIIQRLVKKKNWLDQQLTSSSEGEEDQDEEDEDQDDEEEDEEEQKQCSGDQQKNSEMRKKGVQGSGDQQSKNSKGRKEMERVDDPEEEFIPGCFVAAVYQGAWYVAVVLDKKMEKNALVQDEYEYLSFMQRLPGGGDLFRWPDKPDKLNTLKEDILFKCGNPIPSATTSSNRSITYTLSKLELKKAHILLNKAYYHTKSFLYLTYFFFLSWLKLTKDVCVNDECGGIRPSMSGCRYGRYLCV